MLSRLLRGNVLKIFSVNSRISSANLFIRTASSVAMVKFSSGATTGLISRQLYDTAKRVEPLTELINKLGNKLYFYMDNLKENLANKGYVVIDSSEALTKLIDVTFTISNQWTTDMRSNNLVMLFNLIPEEHLRKIINTPEKLLDVTNALCDEKPGTYLLQRLGKAHVSSLMNDFDQTIQCQFPSLIEMLEGKNLTAMIDTFEKLQRALAWSSFRDHYRNGVLTQRLLSELGHDHVMSLIKDGNQLTALLTNKRIEFCKENNHDNYLRSAAINSGAVIDFMSIRLSQFKNTEILEQPAGRFSK